MPLGPLEDDVQPAVAANPRQGALNDPANTLRNEGSAVAAGAGLEGDAERLAGFGQPLAPIAEIAQGSPLEAGKLMQHRDDALAVMDIRRRDGDRQRKAVLVDREMDLDALDLLATIEATAEASRCRTTRPAVDDDGAGFGSIAASLPPRLDQAVEQPAPQAKPGPSSKQRVQGAERNVAQLADRAPLHAAKADAPNRHDRLAQGCSGQWRLRPAPCWLRARHGPAITASTKASTSRKASHEARDVLAGLKAVPILLLCHKIDC